MAGNVTFFESVLRFNDGLAHERPALPEGFDIVNPLTGEQRERVECVTRAFYQRYYNDTRPRRLILGSSPARRGSAVTGVPFDDAQQLQRETGIRLDAFHVQPSSSDFLAEVMRRYGGRERFYSDFYMNFVCPLGIVKTNAKGRAVNCNYYEDKKLAEALLPLIVRTIQGQIALGVDPSVCYCIGSGENYRFLSQLNADHRFFGAVIALEHPRFITQYHATQRDAFIEKYLKALCGPSGR